jgi:hypothetical protein
VEHLLLAPVDDLAGALADLHGRGLRIAGSEADAPLTARQSDLRGPLAIVVGSEGQGLGPAIRKRCDLLMRIPMRGAVGSLNAAVAGSILLFEAVAQRDPDGRAAHLACSGPRVGVKPKHATSRKPPPTPRRLIETWLPSMVTAPNPRSPRSSRASRSAQWIGDAPKRTPRPRRLLNRPSR